LQERLPYQGPHRYPRGAENRHAGVCGGQEICAGAGRTPAVQGQGQAAFAGVEDRRLGHPVPGRVDVLAKALHPLRCRPGRSGAGARVGPEDQVRPDREKDGQGQGEVLPAAGGGRNTLPEGEKPARQGDRRNRRGAVHHRLGRKKPGWAGSLLRRTAGDRRPDREDPAEGGPESKGGQSGELQQGRDGQERREEVGQVRPGRETAGTNGRASSAPGGT